MRLWGVMTARLSQDLTTADKKITFPAGTLVTFQFDPQTPVAVVKDGIGAQPSMTASFKELAGSELMQ